MTLDYSTKMDIIKLHNNGKSLREIASLTNCSHSTVQNIVNSNFEPNSIQVSVYDSEVANKIRVILDKQLKLYQEYEKLFNEIKDKKGIKWNSEKRKLIKNMGQNLMDNALIFQKFGSRILLSFEKRLELEQFSVKDSQRIIINNIINLMCPKCRDKLLYHLNGENNE